MEMGQNKIVFAVNMIPIVFDQVYVKLKNCLSGIFTNWFSPNDTALFCGCSAVFFFSFFLLYNGMFKVIVLAYENF